MSRLRLLLASILFVPAVLSAQVQSPPAAQQQASAIHRSATADKKASVASGVSVQWRPGMPLPALQQASIVRIAPGFHASDLDTLRDDQWLETPSGHRVNVATVRAFRSASATIKARSLRRVEVSLLHVTRAGCSQLKPGETQQEILARPPSDVICLPSGKRISVQQLRAAVPYVQRHPEIDWSRVGRSPPIRPAVRITDAAQLREQLAHAPDSTVLISPKGTRTTVAQVKAALHADAARTKGKQP